MKIAIPVDSRSMDEGVCQSFGRAPYFLIYDVDEGESTFIENSATQSRGGAGIKAAQLIVDSGAAALITPRCGENAGAVLKKGEIKIYKATAGSVIENIDRFKAGELSILDQVHEGFHNHNGR